MGSASKGEGHTTLAARHYCIRRLGRMILFRRVSVQSQRQCDVAMPSVTWITLRSTLSSDAGKYEMIARLNAQSCDNPSNFMLWQAKR
jgi:hypothetical protein